MTRGRSRKPCPGCGQVVIGRKADAVCHDCRRDIEENKKRQEREAALLAQKEQQLVQLPRTPHYLPTLPHAGAHMGYDQEPARQFQMAFLDLARLLGTPASQEQRAMEVLIVGTEHSYDAPGYLFAPVAVAQLRALYAAATDSCKAAYANGQEFIRRAFQRVVSGDIELKRFAEQMQLDTAEITSRVIFAGAPGAVPDRLLLCEVGQVDAKGQVVTTERLDEIEKLYQGMGVPIDRVGDQLWTKPREAK